MLRDNVHYLPVVFEVAARIVHQMGGRKYNKPNHTTTTPYLHTSFSIPLTPYYKGPFAFSSMHLRRNDLQYKEVFIGAKDTFSNIHALMTVPHEKMYIATDAKDASYFAVFEEHGFPVYRWSDFFEAKGGKVLEGVHIPRKLEGCIEQVVCAMGRTFSGTLESTFSSYIFRLRGYYQAPSTEVYFHTLGPYVNDVVKDRRITYARKPPKGQIYKSEHPSIWEDARSEKTWW